MGKRKLCKNIYFGLDNTNEHDKIASTLRLCAAFIQATKRSLYSLAVAYIACDFIEFVGNVNRYVRILIDQKLCM